MIRSYRADIDPGALGRDVRAVIDVSLPAGGDPAEFEVRIAERDEVELPLYITGPAGYTLIVDCIGAEGLEGSFAG